MQTQDRQPAVAGTFYTNHPQLLRDEIHTFFNSCETDDINGEIMALISPHAGYMYSGQVAAYGYGLLKGQHFDTVIVIAPSHHVHFEGNSVYNRGGYQTPLGRIPLDTELVGQLEQHPDIITFRPDAHAREHSLEVQLPFLQDVLDGFSLVPIIMGNQDWDNCVRLAEIVAAAACTKRTLIVASSDLSHFHDYDTAVQLDSIVLDSIRAYDPRQLWNDIADQKCEACGAGPIVTAMLAAQILGAGTAQVLNYANSGDVSGDRSRVVGYASGVVYRGN